VALVLGTWRHLAARGRLLLLLHLLLSGLGGVLWQAYALLVVAAPSRYHPPRGWAQLLSSAADYGFVLGRWLLPVPTTGRVGLPDVLWAALLAGLFALLRPPNGTELWADNVPRFQPQLPARLMLQALWSASLALVVLVAGLTVFAQSAAGIHDAERYASVLFGPVVLLVLAAWPARGPRWLGPMLLVVWGLGAAVRVGHVARDLRRVTPLNSTSIPGPGPYGQQVGAAGK